MKAIKKYIPILTLIILVLTSCEKTVTNVDLPEIEPKLVVQSFISPQDKEIKVYVSESKPVFGESNNNSYEFPPISNASVIISDGTNTKTLVFNSSKGYYFISATNFAIVAGGTYTLNVSTPNGMKSDASCTVPTNHPTTFEITSIEYDVNNQKGQNVVKTRFKDIAGEDNYYRIFAYNKFANAPGDTIYEQLYSEYGEELFSDNNQGEWISHQFYFYEGKVNKLQFDILNVDEHYYKYHKSVFNSDFESPFSEAVLVYSNINNGLGVFCAYNGISVEVDVK
ncbi:MAG: DUF4249 domain-containing protein [Saprospiraceae bacterium]|nr:DUF4249 domain-containing protein [Saprospiraceae bacterium]